MGTLGRRFKWPERQRKHVFGKNKIHSTANKFLEGLSYHATFYSSQIDLNLDVEYKAYNSLCNKTEKCRVNENYS